MNQSTSSIDTNKGVTERKAPVGHRQPALKELPAEVLQREQAPSSIRANLVFGSDTPSERRNNRLDDRRGVFSRHRHRRYSI